MATKKPLSRAFTAFPAQLLYILIVPTFFLVFTTLYRPPFMVSFLDMGRDLFSFNVTIVAAILFGVVLISRTLMMIVRHQMRFRYWSWILWQGSEIVAMSLFMALYLTLMYHGAYTYYTVVGTCLGILLLVEFFPYMIIGLGLGIAAAKEEHAPVEDDSLMRFRDQQKQVKLMIASSAVLYIEAQENYVLIRYLDGEVVKEYSLRSSMVALEPLMDKHGLVRCQRSYYINPTHIKVLRKDKEGQISAELDTPHQKAIPVSPKYYDAVSARL